MAENSDFGHAPKRSGIARNRRDFEGFSPEGLWPPPSSTLNVQFFPFRRVTPVQLEQSSQLCSKKPPSEPEDETRRLDVACCGHELRGRHSGSRAEGIAYYQSPRR